VIGALRIEQWFSMWRMCHSMIDGQPVRAAFPDGQPLDQQLALLVNVFIVIEDEWRKAVADQVKHGSQ
jgi:hypothetical protein